MSKLNQEELLEWLKGCYYDAGNEFYALKEDEQAYQQIKEMIKRCFK